MKPLKQPTNMLFLGDGGFLNNSNLITDGLSIPNETISISPQLAKLMAYQTALQSAASFIYG